MKKVKGYISVRALGTYNYEFYVPDDATDEDIKKKVYEVEQMSHRYSVEEGYKEVIETRYVKR